MLYHSIIINDSIAAAETYSPPTDCKILYDVIRVTEGDFLFLNDHINRLNQSAEILGVRLVLSVDDIRNQLEKLMHQNGIQTGNIKIEYYFYAEKLEYQAVYFIQHHYPTKDEYLNGVKTSLFTAERTNPNAKIIQHYLREQTNQLIIEKNIYEVILVHPDGYITEGSRSTFFMVKNGTVYTAPIADVLPGITRKYVLQACCDLSVPFEEKRITPEQLSDMDAVFIAGTSPKILPVSQVDECIFETDNAIVKQLMKKYDEMAGIDHVL